MITRLIPLTLLVPLISYATGHNPIALGKHTINKASLRTLEKRPADPLVLLAADTASPDSASDHKREDKENGFAWNLFGFLPENLTAFIQKYATFYNTDDPAQQKVIIQMLLGVMGFLLVWGAKLWIKNIVLKFFSRVILILVGAGLIYFLFFF